MKNVEDLLPLTPMQRVMLLHARTARQGSDALFHQFTFELEGELDEAAFQQAWSDVVARHAALRTAFVWEGIPEPLQVVRREIDVPFRITACAGEAEADRLCAEDRALGFDLSRAPLIRLSLLRREDRRWTFLWSSHHLVIDRWCIGLVLADVAEAYAARRAGRAPAPARRGQFRDYVAFQRGVPEDELATFWRRALAGLRSASREFGGERAASNRVRRRVPAEVVAALRSAAREHGVTVAALQQTALALVLAGRAGRGDVVFGATVAGRPPEVPGIDTMVGTLIGNVPVRARLSPEDSPIEAARALLRQARERTRYEFAAPDDLHGHARLRPTERLFDVLLVQLDATTPGSLEGVRITTERGSVESPYAVTVSVEDAGAELLLEVASRTVDTSWADALLDALAFVAREAGGRLGAHADFEGAGPLPCVAEDTAEGTAVAERQGRERDGLEIVEEFVLAEVRALLGVEHVDPDRSFFDQGGTSLTASQLHVRLEAALGRSIGILELFAAEDLRSLARTAHSAGGALRADVVRTLQFGDADEPPLVCLASPEVNALGYVSLTRHLPPTLPVLVAQGAPDTDVPFRMAVSDIEPLAEAYADALAKSGPTRRVRLLGMCDGALLCIALARALDRRGVEVDFIGILNTHALGTLSWRFKLRRLGNRARYYRDRIAERARARRAVEPEPAVVPDVRPEAAAEATGPPADSKVALQERLARVNHEWFTTDRPRGLPATERYGGALTLFRIAPQPYWRVRDPLLGWGRHAESVDVVPMEPYFARVGGGRRRSRHELHLSLLREPEVRGTALAVTEALARSEVVV